MSEVMIYLCRGEAKAVAAVESEWDALKLDHAEAMKVLDVEDWVRTCLQHRDAAIRRLDSVSQRAFTGDLSDFDGLGKVMLFLFDGVIALCESVLQNVHSVVSSGYEVVGAAPLGAAVDELRTAREHFKGWWPWPDPAAWQRSRQDIKAGRSRTTREILNELRSRSPQLDSTADREPESAS